MFCDAHIHIGQFYDIYTSAEELVQNLSFVGIDCVAISSTSTCEENYEKVKKELKDFITLFAGLAFPVLWITPKLLKNEIEMQKLLSCGIQWAAIKVHPQLCPDEWDALGENYKKTLVHARELKIPIIIHTGVVKNCHPLHLISLFNTYSEQTFIMAHGRPIDEAMFALGKCPNTLVDTAFMPIEDITMLINQGYSKRILWGSDYPIIKFYERGIDGVKYYQDLICSLKASIGKETYDLLTCHNVLDVFDNHN